MSSRLRNTRGPSRRASDSSLAFRREGPGWGSVEHKGSIRPHHKTTARTLLHPPLAKGSAGVGFRGTQRINPPSPSNGRPRPPPPSPYEGERRGGVPWNAKDQPALTK